MTTTNMTLALTNNRFGRIILHTVAAILDHQWGWHFGHICHQLKK